MLVPENASSENAGSKKCRHWKMSVAENAGTGKCWYRKMPVLKMPLLENAGTGKSWYWKMSVLEIANTVRSQVKFILPMLKVRRKESVKRPCGHLLLIAPVSMTSNFGYFASSVNAALMLSSTWHEGFRREVKTFS